MGKKKKYITKEKKERRRSSSSGLKEKIIADWKERNPILKFAVGFGILMAIFYGFWFSDIFVQHILTPVAHSNAFIASKILNIFGFHTVVNGQNLFSSEFSISIKKGCDALEPIAIFLFAVLLFPAPFKTKLTGLVVGVPCLFIVNQIRIITLFLTGVYAYELFGDFSNYFFDIMHMQVWQVIFIIITLIFLAYWILWSMKKEKMALTENDVTS